MADSGIERVSLEMTSQMQVYNIQFYDYKLDGLKADYEALAVDVSKCRATSIENEVVPLTKVIKTRNKEIEELGTALSDCTGAQKNFSDSAGGGETTSLQSSTISILNKYSISYTANGTTITNQHLAELVQLLKTKIDALNNDAQMDMTSLQSYTEKRDESYSLATQLMTKISDTRSNALKNIQ